MHISVSEALWIFLFFSKYPNRKIVYAPLNELLPTLSGNMDVIYVSNPLGSKMARRPYRMDFLSRTGSNILVLKKY